MKIPFLKKSAKDQSLTPNPNRRKPFSRAGKDPKTDWIIIFSFSLILAIVLVGLGLRKYIQPATISENSILAGKNVPKPIDSNLLDKILDSFAKREELRKAIIKNYSGPSDPSLISR